MFRSIKQHLQRLSSVHYCPSVRFDVGDYGASLAIGLLAGALSLFLSAFLDLRLYDEGGFDVWFQADTPRVFGAMADGLGKYHFRTSVHPLFSVLSTPFVSSLRLLGVSPFFAARLLVALSGFVSAGALFLSFRGLGIPKWGSGLFVCVLLASATYLNWFCIIETYAMSAASICLMLLVLISARTSRSSVWTLASAATLAVTITDWVLGIAATFVRLEPRRVLRVTIGALVLVVAISIWQKSLYPSAVYFFNPFRLAHEGTYTPLRSAKNFHQWRPWENLRSVLLSSAVAPSPQLVSGELAGGWVGEKIITNQQSSVGTYSPADWLAAIAWTALILCGIDGAYRSVSHRSIVLAVTIYLCSQVFMCLVYGAITFLYSCLFFPSLVLLAGFGWFSRARSASVSSAVIFVICGAYGNFMHFKEAVALVHMAFER
jgi:hypothetical protein